MIDTNILISSALSDKGTPYKAYLKVVTYPNHVIHESVGIFLTGDKDFLEANVSVPKILTASQFLQL